MRTMPGTQMEDGAAQLFDAVVISRRSADGMCRIRDVSVNVVGTYNVLEAALKMASAGDHRISETTMVLLQRWRGRSEDPPLGRLRHRPDGSYRLRRR